MKVSANPSWFYNEFRQVGTDFTDPTVVATYDRNQHSSTVEAEQALVEQLGITAGNTVIDLGCGTGTFAIQAALTGARVHAVDVSQPMLAYARQKAAAAGLSNRIQFHHQGLLSYNHNATPADFIVTQAALHHLPDFWKMVTLLRITAMLRPDGVFYLWDTVFSFPPSEFQAHIQTWMARAAIPMGEGWTVTDFETHVRDEYTTFSWILERMLEETGFVIETVERASSVITAYTCRKKCSS
ncbi:MAG: class I SAM-dependent methyltransferase [Elainella sp. C42_A2020_010]|nr:class I SAM-dependent methyltransferase [Elainella sp. C42_A2020_010]